MTTTVRPIRKRAHRRGRPPVWPARVEAWGEILARGRSPGRGTTRGNDSLTLRRAGTILSPPSSRTIVADARGSRAQPLHQRRVGRLRRWRQQPGREPVRRRSWPRSTSRPTSRSRRRSPPPASAFDRTDWPRTPTAERAALLDRVAGLIDRDLEEMARLETLNTGKAMRESRWDMSDVARVFRYYADLADKEAGRLVDTGNPDALSRIVREPIGVCGLIGPWNYPLLQMSWKIAPALAAGNTAVMKPAQLTPLSTIHLTRLFEEAGVPAGVVNLVLGPGRARRPGARRQPRRRHGLADRRPRRRRARCCAARPATSSGSPSSSAARARTSSSPTPTSRPPSTTR